MASRTALKIARVIVQAGSDPDLSRLLPPGAAESTASLLSGCGLLPGWMAALLARPGFRRLAADLERAVSPGVSLHMVLRKRFIDDQARDALDGGATQCLVLGAGFDSLAVRLAPAFPDALFVEIERPATLLRKAAGIERAGGVPENLRLLGADLGSTPLAEALTAAGGWDDRARSVLVAEGLLMYLSPRDAEGLFRSVPSIAGAGTRVLFTHLEPDEKGRPQVGRGSRILRASLRLLGEPFRWAIGRGELGARLEPLGFRLALAAAAEDLRRLYLEPAGLGDLDLFEGEGLAVAELRAP